MESLNKKLYYASKTAGLFAQTRDTVTSYTNYG